MALRLSKTLREFTDNLRTCHESLRVDLYGELKKLLSQGGFNLTKWTSNEPAVLNEIPEADQSKKIRERAIDAPLEKRALGVYWNVEEDYFRFKVQQMDKSLIKRGS